MLGIIIILVFSYFWSVVIYKLAISKKIHFIILAIGLYALWGYYTLWSKELFIISGFFVTALYFGGFMFFHKDFSKKLVIFSSFVCVFCLWQLEVPQRIILDITHKYSNLNVKIIDNNYKIMLHFMRAKKVFCVKGKRLVALSSFLLVIHYMIFTSMITLISLEIRKL